MMKLWPNYEKFYFWWLGNPACDDSADSNEIEKENWENGEYDFITVGIGAILGIDVQFKGKNMFHYSRGVKRQQGFTTGAEFYVHNGISFIFKIVPHGLVAIMPEIQISDSGSIPRWEWYDLLLDI